MEFQNKTWFQLLFNCFKGIANLWATARPPTTRSVLSTLSTTTLATRLPYWGAPRRTRRSSRSSRSSTRGGSPFWHRSSVSQCSCSFRFRCPLPWLLSAPSTRIVVPCRRIFPSGWLWPARLGAFQLFSLGMLTFVCCKIRLEIDKFAFMVKRKLCEILKRY